MSPYRRVAWRLTVHSNCNNGACVPGPFRCAGSVARRGRVAVDRTKRCRVENMQPGIARRRKTVERTMAVPNSPDTVVPDFGFEYSCGLRQ